jgi:nucleoside-diphosphate-sugar epimerase
MGIPSKKAFITGLNGFTGVHLANYLFDQKWEICGLGLNNNASTLYAKLEEKDKIVAFLKNQKPTHIFHLAGISFVGHQNQEDFYKVNTIGTQTLLDAIIESKIDVVEVGVEPANADEHFTVVELSSPYCMPIAGPTLKKIKDHLQDIYRIFIRNA